MFFLLSLKAYSQRNLRVYDIYSAKKENKLEVKSLFLRNNEPIEELLNYPELEEISFKGGHIHLTSALGKLKKLRYILIYNIDSLTFSEDFSLPCSVNNIDVSTTSIKRFPKELLVCNQLEHLKVETFSKMEVSTELLKLQNLTSLKILNATFSKELQDELIKNETLFPKLQELEVEGCGLNQFPKCFSSNEGLTSLVIGKNNLKSFPKSILKMKNLTKLNLSNIDFKNLPDAISELKSLKILELDSCGMTSLPESFKELKSLEQLRLNHNNFGEVPAAIFSLKELTFLLLGDAGIKEIPKEIGTLRKLRDLSFSDNQIKEVPAELFTLKFFQLYLDYNQIEKIHAFKDNKVNMFIVSITNNKLSKLSDEFLVLNIASLKLSNNNFTSIPRFTNNHLNYLEIENNKIDSFTDKDIYLFKLRRVQLYGNPIKSIPSHLYKLDFFKKSLTKY